MKEDVIEYISSKIRYFILPSKENKFQSRILQSNILLYCVILVLSLKILAIAVSINFPQNMFFADVTKSVLQGLVNEARQSSGLTPLTENKQLSQAAQLKAENMIQNQYFDHTSPTGVSPWYWFSQAGYKYKYAGENLAIGFYESEEVYNAWLNSPSHKANILSPYYTEVGTAVLKGFGESKAIVVVQEFGSPLPSSVTQATKAQTPTKTSVPVSKAQTSTTIIEKEVLSQTTVPQNIASKAINSVKYNYSKLIQDIIYGLSMIAIGVLIVLIFFSFSITFKKELVFRAVLIVTLLSVATLLNKEIIIALIPHQIFI